MQTRGSEKTETRDFFGIIFGIKLTNLIKTEPLGDQLIMLHHLLCLSRYLYCFILKDNNFNFMNSVWILSNA